ncbi:MAG TPA: cytochrome c peroxidase [Gemmatimonadales bacterium]
MSRLRILALLIPVVVGACSSESALEPELGPAASREPSDDAAVVSLGRALFFDERLSVNGNQSCASCHNPAWGWTGPSATINAAGAVYQGSIPGAFGDRKPPSSAYATQSPILHYDGVLFVGGNFWDGRATGERLGNAAAEQALGPFLNPAEQALALPSDVVSRVCDGPYGDLFRQVGGTALCDAGRTGDAYDFIGLAIAAFEGSAESNAFSSKFDHFLRRQARLTPEELQGLALFRGKGKCAACHVLEGSGRGLARGTARAERPLLTDFTFDNLGLPANPENPQGPGHVDKGLGGFLLTRSDHSALAAGNLGKHKVPTLRNVDLRPAPGSVKAYGHNGYFKTLEGIVHFYNTRDVKPRCPGAYTEAEAIAADCWPAPEYEATMNRSELGDLGLTPRQERAIVAYLKTLSDGFIP